MTTPIRRETCLFIDLSSSGYDPRKDTILELAFILADLNTLEILHADSWVVRHAEGTVSAPAFHDALLAECSAPDDTAAELAGHPVNRPLRRLEGFLLAGPWTSASVVCARALDFRLKFLKAHMPTLERALPRTQLEINQIELFATEQCGAEKIVPSERTYRAGDDCAASYEALRYYADKLRPTTHQPERK
jgi:oligoribonuclease (3'-5' exoribonuclease)